MSNPIFRTTLIAASLLAAPMMAQDAETGSAGPVQTRDGTYLKSVEDVDVTNAEGEVIGEIEEILVNADGEPAGFRVELDSGLFDFGDDDVSIPLEALTWSNGQYVSKMSKEQLEKLRPWDE
ncbi:PRC-barrel domain-containing protein [Rhodobacteraceae bacterium KMM 6894]|nr:PRC-barrel domain-containing protein [Rhodobacteraceae bacterium KMM 6894]